MPCASTGLQQADRARLIHNVDISGVSFWTSEAQTAIEEQLQNKTTPIVKKMPSQRGVGRSATLNSLVLGLGANARVGSIIFKEKEGLQHQRKFM
jgi:hypothetical protein